jgi:hypothetical protein
MTLLELKGLVDFRYARESERLQQPTYIVEHGEFKLYHDTIMNEILSELNINELSENIAITPVTTYTVYPLPSVYGGLKGYECVFNDSLISLELVDISEVPTVGDLTQGTPTKLAIFPTTAGLYNAYLYPLSGFTGVLSIRYKLLHAISAGEGVEASLTGNLNLPAQYVNLLITGILSMLMPEFEPKYRYMLDNAPLLNAVPTQGSTDYNLGGYE